MTRNLINSYLTDRTYVISMDGIFSKVFKLRFGSPQGTVLSPFLFLVLTNDLFLWLLSNIDMRAVDYMF